MQATHFEIAIPQEDLDDLHARLARVRWPADFANDDWGYGTNTGYLKELVEYWRTRYDWRTRERAMNAFRHLRTEIDGVPIHFIHEKGQGPQPIPIILNHGWPWTFWDLHKVIRPLADPAAFGGDPADAFDVIVPSLPGFGFSTPLTRPGVNFDVTADLWLKLMRDVLGYERFAAQGGDWGAFVSAQLAHKYAEHLIGIHLHLVPRLGAAFGATPVPEDYDPDEVHWAKQGRNFLRWESAYADLQGTKPQTIATALNDSPVGLCAWILEKRRTWSDCGGDVEKVFSKDELLDTIMLYWFTQSYGTSARYYYETWHKAWKPAHERQPMIDVPTGVAAFDKEVIPMPRRWTERLFNLQRWTRFNAGGHFAPMEKPREIIDEVRAFFRPLRGPLHQSPHA